MADGNLQEGNSLNLKWNDYIESTAEYTARKIGLLYRSRQIFSSESN